MTTAAIYARFSSELQDERSLADQIALCRTHAERQGWNIGAIHTDAAISGASTIGRAGLAALLEDARAGRLHVVITESLDRLSRDLEDLAGIHKRLAFAGVEIVTLADGAVSDIHVGVKGLVASLFLKDLAQKTKRGHIGRLKAGLVPGGKLYGYDTVPGAEGERRINEREAAIVRRIFAEYAAGRSPRQIVRELNAEGVPAPRGGLWNASTITGSAKRQNGIINSRLYVGEIVYNRERMVKDPATGKRVHRINPPADWIVQDAPQLAIVERALFDAAGARRATLGQAKLTYRRRPKHLFSGLVRCGCCGHPLTITTHDRLACSGRTNKEICGNRRTIAVGEVEQRVLGAVQMELLHPEYVKLAVEEYRKAREELARKRAETHRQVAKDMATVEGKIARIVQAIESGGDVPALAARLAGLEAERRELVGRSKAGIPDNVLAVYPKAAERYRETVRDVAAAIARPSIATDNARQLVRELVTQITVTPAGEKGRQAITLSGNLAALLTPNPAGTHCTDGSGTPLQPIQGMAWPFKMAC